MKRLSLNLNLKLDQKEDLETQQKAEELDQYSGQSIQVFCPLINLSAAV